MRLFLTITILITVIIPNDLAAQKQPAKTIGNSKSPQIKLKSHNDSLQYALGIYMGKLLMQGGFLNINSNIFLSGIDDMFRNNPRLISDSIAFPMIERYQVNTQKERGKMWERELFAALQNKPGMARLPSGVQYFVLKPGTPNGQRPYETDSVKIHFKGTLASGTVFENTFIPNTPVSTTPASLLPGLKEVVVLMPVGATWQIFVPAAMAYGEQGKDVIPANSALIIVIELLEVKKN